MLLPPGRKRARYHEQWRADLDGAAALGLAPAALAAGMVTAALTVRLTHLRHAAARRSFPQGAPMSRILPIGPLALFLRALHGDRAQPIAIVLAATLVAALLAGAGLLLM